MYIKTEKLLPRIHEKKIMCENNVVKICGFDLAFELFKLIESDSNYFTFIDTVKKHTRYYNIKGMKQIRLLNNLTVLHEIKTGDYN